MIKMIKMIKMPFVTLSEYEQIKYRLQEEKNLSDVDRGRYFDSCITHLKYRNKYRLLYRWTQGYLFISLVSIYLALIV